MLRTFRMAADGTRSIETAQLHYPARRGGVDGDDAEPCKSFQGPFHLAMDQQDRIWVSNAADFVIRFPASDPTKAEKFKTGDNNSGLNIDSKGNVWVTNRFGAGLLGMAHLVDLAVRLKFLGFVGSGLHNEDPIEADGGQRQRDAARA